MSSLSEITKKLFIRTHTMALIWVTYSYLIGGYATIVLHEPFPLEELSQQAIIVIFGTIFLKVLENSFEHNEGGIFGHSIPKEEPPAEETAECEE